jgi:integrase/recombinase XerD
VELYFELKGTLDSSREFYWRRMNAFLIYMHERNRPIEEMKVEDIQKYILFLKKEKRISIGTINNSISAIKFFYTYVRKEADISRRQPHRCQTLPNEQKIE